MGGVYKPLPISQVRYVELVERHSPKTGDGLALWGLQSILSVRSQKQEIIKSPKMKKLNAKDSLAWTGQYWLPECLAVM